MNYPLARFRFGTALLLLLLLALPRVASAKPLSGTWPTAYRNDIKVYLCSTTFTTHLSGLDQTVLAHNIRLAIDVWNTYSSVDFRLRYVGTRSGMEAAGCAPTKFPAAGEVTIKAEIDGGNRVAAVASQLSNGLATMSIYKQNSAGVVNDWTFDNTASGVNIVSVLIHEFGHVIGFPDDHDAPYATVMNRQGGWQRVLWTEDLKQLRDPSQPHHYNQVATRQIRHLRSTNAGLSWAPEGNLAQFTNSAIGVAFNAAAPSAQRYLVVWRGTNVTTNLNTILGDGANYVASSKRTLSQASNFGPAAAYGNGRYLMLHVTTSDSRNIEYMTSTDGMSWSGSATLLYQGGTNYGSMWEPAAAYNANKQRFVAAWTNWQNVHDDNPLSHLRFCTSADPASQNFSNCTEAPTLLSATAPGLTCHASANECMVTWTNHMGWSGHQICVQKGTINASHQFQLTGSSFCFSSENTKVSPSVAFGFGSGTPYYLLGWRGADDSNWANSTRQTAWPTWTDKALPDPLLGVAPALVYGSSWGEFAMYYVRR